MQLGENDFEDVVDGAADESRQYRARRIAVAIPNLRIRRSSQHPSPWAFHGFAQTRETPPLRQRGPDAIDIRQWCAKAVLVRVHEIASITRLLASGRFSAMWIS